MSVTGITPPSVTQAADNSANVQLQRDEQKLVADTKANASQAQLSADSAAIATDRVAVAARTSISTVDVYL
jgi:hypothetical protein